MRYFEVLQKRGVILEPFRTLATDVAVQLHMLPDQLVPFAPRVILSFRSLCWIDSFSGFTALRGRIWFIWKLQRDLNCRIVDCYYIHWDCFWLA